MVYKHISDLQLPQFPIDSWYFKNTIYLQTAITGIEATVLIEGSNGISGTYSGDILSSGTAATADAPILSKFVKKISL